MIDRGLRYLIHEHKPCSSDPGRCAVCLRPIDCAPHLPLTPRATYPAPSLVPRTDMTNGNRHRAADPWTTQDLVRAAVQGER